MSNIGPPNWWLRDKMIELTDKTLNAINETEKKLNAKIEDISETQYNNYNTFNTYNNINNTDIIDNGSTNSIRANIVSSNVIRAKTERYSYSVNVTSPSGENHGIYRITVNKAQPEKLIVSFQENINGIFVHSNSGLNDIFTGNISLTKASNIIGKYSLNISKNGIIPMLPEQNLDNILINIGDINSLTIISWENTQEGFYIFTLNNYIVDPTNEYFNNINNPSTIIFNGSLVFTELLGLYPLVIGNADEKNIQINSLHTTLEGSLLSIKNNFTNISGNTITIKNLNTDIISNNTNIHGNINIQGNSINIGTNIITSNLVIGNQHNTAQMYKINNGVSNTNVIKTHNINIDTIRIELLWKDLSETDLLQGKIYDNNKLHLTYLNNNNNIISYNNAKTILHNKLKSFIDSNYKYVGNNFIQQNLFSLDVEDSIQDNLNKFNVTIIDTTNDNNFPTANITSVNFIDAGNSGKIVELELDNNISSNSTSTYSKSFEMSLSFIIQPKYNTLYINGPGATFNLEANEGIFNFAGNLTINAGNIIEVAREHVDICSNKIILNGGVTGLTLTPDASIEVQHHEGITSYGTITYSGRYKEWNITPSINSTNYITTGTYLNVGTDLTVSNSALISNKLYVQGSTTVNRNLYVQESTTLNRNLYVKEETTMEKSLTCSETITGKQGLLTNRGLFIRGMIPSAMNDISTGINIKGFYWYQDSSNPPESLIPANQKIIDKDYKIWDDTEPTYTNTNRLVTIVLNELILNSWDTYHIITRGNIGRFEFRTAVLLNVGGSTEQGVILDGKYISFIKVFHNSGYGYAPTINPTMPGYGYSTCTRTDQCTQISLFSFIETTGTINTLILNIHTVDNLIIL